MAVSYKNISKKIGYAFLATLFVALVHLWPGKTMLTYHSEWDAPGSYFSLNYLTHVVEYHQTNPTFATRTAGTWLVLGTANLFSVSPGLALVWVSVFFLFVSLYGLLSVAQALYGTVSALTSVLYVGSFSILFAWFPNIYTYDEPLQYSLLFAALALLLRNRVWAAVLFFALAVYVRENSLFLLPGFWLVARHRIPSQALQNLWALPVFCVLILFLKKMTVPQEVAVNKDGLFSAERIEHLYYNFQDFFYGTETFLSAVLAILVPVAMLLRLRHKQTDFVRAFWVSFLLNAVMVVLFARARETRLFALPLVFVWPLLHTGNLSFLPPARFFRLNAAVLRKKGLGFLAVATLSYFIAFAWYQPTETLNENTFQVYLFVAQLLLWAMALYPKADKTGYVHSQTGENLPASG